VSKPRSRPSEVKCASRSMVPTPVCAFQKRLSSLHAFWLLRAGNGKQQSAIDGLTFARHIRGLLYASDFDFGCCQPATQARRRLVVVPLIWDRAARVSALTGGWQVDAHQEGSAAAGSELFQSIAEMTPLQNASQGPPWHRCPPHRCPPRQAAIMADNSRATKGAQMTRCRHGHRLGLPPGRKRV
jgi:hypothetical protein